MSRKLVPMTIEEHEEVGALMAVIKLATSQIHGKIMKSTPKSFTDRFLTGNRFERQISRLSCDLDTLAFRHCKPLGVDPDRICGCYYSDVPSKRPEQMKKVLDELKEAVDERRRKAATHTEAVV